MKLQEVKNMVALAHQKRDEIASHIHTDGGIIIENNITGTNENSISRLGGKNNKFKPYTDHSFWSSWRIGIPYKWKGKGLVLWLKGYNSADGESVSWLCDSIWNVDTNKPLRKDASVNCWDHVRSKAKEVNIDITDIKAKRIDSEDIIKGWTVSHLGIDWSIEPVTHRVSSGFWVKCLMTPVGRYASLKNTVKEAKAFIKYDSGEWLSNNQIKSI